MLGLLQVAVTVDICVMHLLLDDICNNLFWHDVLGDEHASFVCAFACNGHLPL